MTSFLKARVTVPAAGAAALADAIEAIDEPAPLAVTRFEEPGGAMWTIDAYFDEATDEAALGAALAAAVPGAGAVVLELVPGQDWAALVQRELKPVHAGRLVVHGSHDRARVGSSRWAIEIEAGEAFGTAHHATTEGCLMALDLLARGRPRHRVLDLGCGTAVLAIAAARLWPTARIVASDIDPVATRIAADNARLNRVADRVRVITAPGTDHALLRRPASFELILANILAGPLVELAPALVHLLTRGGVIVLSGLLAVQSREVEATYRAHGLHVRQRLPRGEWMTLVLAR